MNEVRKCKEIRRKVNVWNKARKCNETRKVNVRNEARNCDEIKRINVWIEPKNLTKLEI